MKKQLVQHVTESVGTASTQTTATNGTTLHLTMWQKFK